MIPNKSFGVANVQVSQLPIICKQIEGYFNGATGAYLQVHDSCTAPGTGVVPIWQMPLNATAQFQQTMQVDELVLREGLFVGVSSTDGTWTASASTMNVVVWTNDPVVAVNLVGNKTTVYTPNILQVWSQYNGAVAAKRLLGLILNEKVGITQYVYLSPLDNYTTAINVNPLMYYLGVLPANGTFSRRFGTGLWVTYKDLNTTSYYGLTVCVSNTVINPNSNVTYVSQANGATILAITN
jgi:hypothetical protein